MDILRLLLFTLRLLAIPAARWEAEIAYRTEMAEACASATEDETERFLCMKIPRYESNYRIDVGRCEVKGPQGELTAWQILPRSREERDRLCRSLVADAEIAIQRIRESRGACRHLPASEQLALYARGRCDSVEGKKLSRTRWPYQGEVRGLQAKSPP